MMRHVSLFYFVFLIPHVETAARYSLRLPLTAASSRPWPLRSGEII